MPSCAKKRQRRPLISLHQHKAKRGKKKGRKERQQHGAFLDQAATVVVTAYRGFVILRRNRRMCGSVGLVGEANQRTRKEASVRALLKIAKELTSNCNHLAPIQNSHTRASSFTHRRTTRKPTHSLKRTLNKRTNLGGGSCSESNHGTAERQCCATRSQT